MDGCLGNTAGLPAAIQAVHIGLALSGACLSIHDGGYEKSEDGDQQKHERQHGGVANASDLPFLSPALQTPVQRPLQQREEDYDDHAKEENVLINVVKNVMPHLVSHDPLYLFRRTAAQQVVIQRDSHRASEATYVGAHARALAGRIDLKNILGGDSIGASHAQDRLCNLPVVQSRNFVKDGNDIDRGDEDNKNQEADGHSRRPNPPGALQPTYYAEQQNHQDAAEHKIHSQTLYLVAHPGAESLRSQPVLVFAKVVFVDRERET